MKSKTQNAKLKQAGIFIVPAVWWGVIGIVLVVHIVFFAVALIISLFFTEPKPDEQIVPDHPHADEMFAPACDCGGNCEVP